jgi:hypothetical protein
MRDAIYDDETWDPDAETVAIPVATPCQCCGLNVPARPRHGALRYPHLCPHGRDCAAGEPALGQYLGDRGTCPECNADRLAERRARAHRAALDGPPSAEGE